MKTTAPTLKVNIDGSVGNVPRAKYVTAKTKQLREFGYNDLSEDDVNKQIDLILEGRDLTVIGMLMKDEVVKP